MRRLGLKLTSLFALCGLALLPAAVRADDFSTFAFDNATVWPTGPRPGDFGKEFFNMEGTDNGMFASYAVADFDSTTLGLDGVTEITQVTIGLNQDNAAFTNNGTINFYIAEDTTTSIQPDDNAVIFDVNDPEGLNGQLAPTHFLGSGTFTQGPSGTPDSFMFTLDAATEAYLIDQITSGGTIRVVITPADPDVSATYAGFTDPSFPGPEITITTPSGN